jgi:hypothetical protein
LRSFLPGNHQFYRKRQRSRPIFWLLAVTVMLVATARPAPARGDTAAQLRSPLRVTGAGSPETGTPLLLEAEAYATLQPHQSVRLTDFALAGGETVELECEQFEVFTPATRIVAGTEEGDVPLPAPDIALFRGRVVGTADSRAVLGVSPRGFYGLVWIGQEGHVVAPARGDAGRTGGADHVVHRTSELQLEPALELSVYDTLMPQGEPLPPTVESPKGTEVDFRAARLALECDYEYWSQFNDYGEALDYIAVLFAGIGDMYERDATVKLALTFIRIWTTASDPYSYVGGDPDGLYEFQNYWNASHNPGQPGFVERDVAHLLSSRGVGAYGWQGVLCNYTGGYSISGGIALLPTLAENLFHDIAYAGHEIGHNMNAQHTHCFDPPIDRCATEPGCNQTQDCSDAPGTIMSYCHSCPGGSDNILLQFHSRNVERMRGHIDSSCLRLVRNPVYVDWRSGGYEDGTASWPYNTVREGVDVVIRWGMVNIANGSYPERITIVEPMTLQATGGTVVIGGD